MEEKSGRSEEDEWSNYEWRDGRGRGEVWMEVGKGSRDVPGWGRCGRVREESEGLMEGKREEGMGGEE